MSAPGHGGVHQGGQRQKLQRQWLGARGAEICCQVPAQGESVGPVTRDDERMGRWELTQCDIRDPGASSLSRK